MDKCPSHEHLIDILKEIKAEAKGMRQDLKDLHDHFDKRHDKSIATINKNQTDIAVLKVKQYVIAALAGMGGGHVQDILKKIIF